MRSRVQCPGSGRAHDGTAIAEGSGCLPPPYTISSALARSKRLCPPQEPGGTRYPSPPRTPFHRRPRRGQDEPARTSSPGSEPRRMDWNGCGMTQPIPRVSTVRTRAYKPPGVSLHARPHTGSASSGVPGSPVHHTLTWPICLPCARAISLTRKLLRLRERCTRSSPLLAGPGAVSSTPRLCLTSKPPADPLSPRPPWAKE